VDPYEPPPPLPAPWKSEAAPDPEPRRTWRRTIAEYLPRDWVFPIVLSCFVGVVVWFGHAIHEFLVPPATTVTVPSFVGTSLVDANEQLARLGLTSTVVEHLTSDRYPADTIINQQPVAGTQVRQGRQLSFVASSGIVARSMPDMRYQSMREVHLDLSRMHLQLGTITYQKSDIVPEDHVVSQNPDPLANVYEGEPVNLVVSLGGSATAKVPSFDGMPVDDARALAARDGIKLGQIVWTPLGEDGPPHGVVARQKPDPGTTIASFDTVSLQVSAGPLESGYILRQVHVLASVPVPDEVRPGEQIRVRLVVHDATGTWTLYDAYAQPGQKMDFTVTALGTSLVDMYADNVLVGETRLGVEPARIYNVQAPPSPSAGNGP
jgi:eukaryotic-like serine/threonine-protein kinase